MSEEDKKQVEVQPVMTISPQFVEVSVVAGLYRDGVFVDHVTAKDKISEVNFNHGLDIETIVKNAKVAMEEKWGAG